MTNWQYETRVFLNCEPISVIADITEATAKGYTKREQKETDLYCVGGNTDIAVRLRGNQLKMKGPVAAVDDLVDQMSDERASLPVDRDVVAQALGFPVDQKGKTLADADAVKAYMKKKGSKTSEVAKDMTKYESPNLEVEVSRYNIDGQLKWTICIAGSDAKKVRKAAEDFGVKKLIDDGIATKICEAEAVKQYGQ